MVSSLKFGPGVPGREALGAKCLEDFLGTGEGLHDEARMETVREEGARRLLRYPLPGTPGEDGNLTGSPRGAGTGWVRLARYRGAGFLEALRTRFTAPRSESLAAREWNLLCVLRSEGVGTPEPLAVGGDVRRSFLVTRELSKVQPVAQWLSENAGGETRRNGLAALASFFGRLLRSGVHLPELCGEMLFIGRPKEPCESSREPVQGKRVRRLPPVFVEDVRGGRLEGVPAANACAGRLRKLFHSLPEAARPSPRECFVIFLRSLRGSASKAELRQLWHEIAQNRS